MKKSEDNSIFESKSNLLISLENQISKLDLLIKNLKAHKNFKLYNYSPLTNLFETKSEDLEDYIFEIKQNYKLISDINNPELKKFKIIILGEKVEALLKYIRILKTKYIKYSKYTLSQSNNNKNKSKIINNKNQLYNQSLLNRQSWLSSILNKLNKAILDKKTELNKILNNNNSDEINNLKNYIIKLENKKTKIEKELFGITEQL